MSAVDFHCFECGEPITGGVSQTKCITCLMGGEDEDVSYCHMCDDEIEFGEEVCESCQAELDIDGQAHWMPEDGLYGVEQDA